MSDAWVSMIAETKLTTEDQARLLVKEPLEVECRKLYVLCANIEAHGHTRSCPGYALLILLGKATKPREDEFRELRRQEKPGGKHFRTESLGESESERGEELELSEVQGMCLRNPGIKMMSRWRFDMRTHLAVTS